MSRIAFPYPTLFPHVRQQGIWEAFIDESLDTLASDHDYKLHDALSLLRRECNVAE